MESRHGPTRRQVAGALALAIAGGHRWGQIVSAGEASTPVPEEAPMSEPTTAFHVVEHEDAEALWELGILAFVKGDSDRTANTFCMVEFLQGVGFATPLHVHHTQDEIFYVLEGTMHGVCDDVEWFAHKGAFVWLPKGSVHGWAVYGDAQVRSLAMTLPGGFDTFVRETGEPATASTLPPASIEIDPAHIAAVAEKYGMSILGPPVNHLN
jgi:mannose-6-phosphate isomerase-like protein (cupin superfamily)